MKNLLFLALLGLMISISSCGDGERLKKAEAKVQTLENAIKKQKASLIELSKTMGRVSQADHDFSQRMAHLTEPRTTLLRHGKRKSLSTRVNLDHTES